MDKDIELFNECISRLKQIGNQNLSRFTNTLQQGNVNTIEFLFNKYISKIQKKNKSNVNYRGMDKIAEEICREE